jgi:hypothetical protein
MLSELKPASDSFAAAISEVRSSSLGRPAVKVCV